MTYQLNIERLPKGEYHIKYEVEKNPEPLPDFASVVISLIGMYANLPGEVLLDEHVLVGLPEAEVRAVKEVCTLMERCGGLADRVNRMSSHFSKEALLAMSR